jgi:methionine aminotransferase
VPDWAQVKSLINERTRMIVVNSPHNPTGSLLTAADLEKLAELVPAPKSSCPTRSTSTSCSTANATPACAASELAARSIVVSSFGKTFHITGWKIGYVVGPAALMAEFRKVHQFNVFVHAPSQLAIAEYMQDAARHLRLAAFYQEKRDFFRQLMAATPFELLPCRGTYFQLARYDRISDLPDRAFAEWMTREVGWRSSRCRSSMPTARRQGGPLLFAKREETLQAAAERLCKAL